MAFIFFNTTYVFDIEAIHATAILKRKKFQDASIANDCNRAISNKVLSTKQLLFAL